MPTKATGVTSANSYNFQNSYLASQKNTNLMTTNNGIKQEIVDLHAQDKAFENIVNKDQFANTVTFTVYPESQSGVSQLSVLSVDRKTSTRWFFSCSAACV